MAKANESTVTLGAVTLVNAGTSGAGREVRKGKVTLPDGSVAYVSVYGPAPVEQASVKATPPAKRGKAKADPSPASVPAANAVEAMVEAAFVKLLAKHGLA